MRLKQRPVSSLQTSIPLDRNGYQRLEKRTATGTCISNMSDHMCTRPLLTNDYPYFSEYLRKITVSFLLHSMSKYLIFQFYFKRNIYEYIRANIYVIVW